MTAIIPLGIFERVALRDAWPTEDGNFTPWLAEPANTALLGETLDMELEVEAVEHRVGSFKADILAKAVNETEHLVLIENQFGRTDHGHLGQMLTYLAGIEGAKTVVWIAERIQEDHRAAIDWLNANTTEEFSFFAIEIELWCIGRSPPAPRFNVKASPNDWSRSAKKAARQVLEDTAQAERHRVRRAYWASFSGFLKDHNSKFHIGRENNDHWFLFAIGRGGFGISATISTLKQRIGVELHIYKDPGKYAFRGLQADKEKIEREFGEALEWQELPGRKAARIALFKTGVDPSDKSAYPALHAWMLAKMDRFRAVFASRVKALPLTASLEAEDEDLPEE